jgi:hypothetical protein
MNHLCSRGPNLSWHKLQAWQLVGIGDRILDSSEKQPIFWSFFPCYILIINYGNALTCYDQY